jgi:CubicO group peptidase (beta-lactamase class C family)
VEHVAAAEEVAEATTDAQTHRLALLAALLACAAGCGPGATSPDAGAGSSDGGGAADAAPATDAGPPPADLAATLEPIRASYGLPALAAAVLDGDRLAALGAVGLRSAGDTVAVTTDDAWHLGSDTKAMTATVAATLVEEGVLAWDETMPELFPDFAASMDPAFTTVTLAHLLAHRAGLTGDLGAEPALWNMLWDLSADPTALRAWLAEQLLTRPPTVPPDVTYVYSNAGYIVAGAALERATGETWEALIAARLFGPLGMSSCGFGAPATPGTVDAPWGHSGTTGAYTPVAPGPYADNPPALGPAGTVHCALADWAKFAALHLAGARGESTFLSAATFAELQTPWPGGDYALGWIVVDRAWAGGFALTHAGSNTMFFANLWIAPAKDRALLVATNAADTAAATAVEDVLGALIADWVP